MHPADIIRAVSEETRIDARSLLDESGKAYYIARPRQLAMLFIRERCGLSWQNISLEVNRAPSTVQYSYAAAKRRLEADIEYRDLYWRVSRRLGGHQ